MQKTFLSTLGISLVAAAATGGTFWAWQWLLEARGQLHRQEVLLAQVPEVKARQVAARAELDKRAFDIERVSGFLVTKDQIGTVVSEIEAAATAAGVEVSVPAVEEKEVLDEAGNIVPPSGPLFEVRLKVVATGRPAALLTFLHAMEHIHRLVYFESFRLDGSDETSRNQARQARQAEEAPGERPALLSVDMIVMVRQEGRGGQL